MHLRRKIRSGEDWQVTLLNFRATPAKLLLGKPISTFLPSRGDPGPEEQHKYIQQKRERTKEGYDKRCQQNLQPLCKGQAVGILDKRSKTWCPGTISKKCEEPKSYTVQTPNGNNLTKNWSHLQELMTGPMTHVGVTPSNNEQLPHTNKEPGKRANAFTDPVLRRSSRVRKPIIQVSFITYTHLKN